MGLIPTNCGCGCAMLYLDPLCSTTLEFQKKNKKKRVQRSTGDRLNGTLLSM